MLFKQQISCNYLHPYHIIWKPLTKFHVTYPVFIFTFIALHTNTYQVNISNIITLFQLQLII